MSAREQIETALMTFWGFTDPTELGADRPRHLVDEAIAEALHDPQHHNAVMAILRRESRIQGRPIHELGAPQESWRVVGEGSPCVLTYPVDRPPRNSEVTIVLGEQLDADTIARLKTSARHPN